jgi:Na+-transporting NADH:ubiquinone oxidoreductase subunit C
MINKSSAVYVLSFMVLLCLVFGTGIAVVHYSMVGLMERNERLLQDKRLVRAFLLKPNGNSPQDLRRVLEENVLAFSDTFGGRTWELYRRTTQPDSGVIGFVFSGIGFWDVIRGILIVTPDLSRIVNIEILKQTETPGLGARIGEEWFKKQFRGLHIAWDAPVGTRVIIGPSAVPNATNRVDAITGATQTSIAVMKSLNEELERFRELYKARLSGSHS